MSTISEQLRRLVAQRAENRCEYCRLPSATQVGRFPVDHVEPRTRDGQTEMANLALACPHCNAHKWAHVTGFDSISSNESPLFNPRQNSWQDHFQWSAENPAVLEGKTAIGRATVQRLQLNHPQMMIVRRLVLELGIQL